MTRRFDVVSAMHTMRIRSFTIALLVIAAAMAVYLFLRARDDSRNGPVQQIHAIAHADQDQRAFEPRLAEGRHYMPAAPISRSSTLSPERLAAALKLKALRDTLPSDGAHYAAAAALYSLFAGDTDAAIDLLREATHDEPREAAYWIDLSAVSLVRGRPTDWLQAIEASEAALELAPSQPEATFNRALALERVGLIAEARDEWQSVANAGQHGWSDEARSHLQRLRVGGEAPPSGDQLLAASPPQLEAWMRGSLDRVRQLVEDDIMSRIATECDAGSGGHCAELLSRTANIAATVASGSDDQWWKALADQLDAWSANGTQRRHRMALRSYGEGVRLFGQDRVADAAKIFTSLSAPAPDQPVTVRWNAVYYVCLDHYFRAEHDAARNCFDALDADLAENRFLYMRGKLNLVRAQISFTEGNLARAAGDFENAVDWLRRAGDTNQLAAAESLRATLRDQLGAFDDAWTDRAHALTTAWLEARRRHTLYTSAARSCLLQGFARTALHFQAAAVANATEWGQPGALLEAHLTQAATYQRLSRVELARQQVEEARRSFEQISDARVRNRFAGELAVASGELLVDIDPGAAVSVLNEASKTLTAQQFDLVRARVEHAIGLASERLHRYADARAAYERGVAIIEQQRDPLAPSLQMQSLDLAWDIYERLISRRLEDEGYPSALMVAESVRTQVLRRFASPFPDPLPTASMLGDALPDQTVLIYFQILEKSTLRWTVSRGGISALSLPISREKMSYLVRRLLRAVGETGSAPALTTASAPLIELMFSGNARPHVGTRLIVVPDGALHELPFAALRDAQTGRYLIEDYPIAIEPSLRLFLSASNVAKRRFAHLQRALIIEGRTGAVKGQAPLAVLPSSQQEINAVAATYSESRILRSEVATPERFLEEAGRYPVVHFSGHAFADRLSFDQSRLFLAPSARSPSGWLTFRDIESSTFPQTALVVLSACSTGAGRVFRGEGAVSLARPFLGKGAAGVVYSLWDIGDEPSSRLLITFHRAIARGFDPVIALQLAQVEAIRTSHTAEDVRTWAAFQYAGGIAAHAARAGERTNDK